jgi:hypothetical protein
MLLNLASVSYHIFTQIKITVIASPKGSEIETQRSAFTLSTHRGQGEGLNTGVVISINYLIAK